ncbi:integrator complex subunit 12-like [Pseudomyrmex gracilis]|uniref:integrator complex subunit 12-like n=1 Tax=Pseudomyrmex gracilis TaxID=219809 RepID=UPI0009952D54|nr:integrator complex subunit 12-like [Pseudomyrmex gracilis]
MITENTFDDYYEDFFDALALLHSTEEDSAEKLRRMLDSCIEKKCGPGKTLAARMPRRFLRSNDKSSSYSMRTAKKRAAEISGEAVSLLAVDEETANRSLDNDDDDDVKVLEVFEECCDSENFPRISIPDDGSAVCKMCNGAKLGAMILLECQECQETYHPLCHQPPIVDVDVYDPRFVWRCKRCLETPVISSRTVEKESAKEVREHNDTLRKDVRKILGKRNGDLFERKNDSPRENRSSQLRESTLFVKDSANNSQKNPPVLQPRKRVGSKLVVARTSIK